jgi:hypothetical protein
MGSGVPCPLHLASTWRRPLSHATLGSGVLTQSWTSTDQSGERASTSRSSWSISAAVAPSDQVDTASAVAAGEVIAPADTATLCVAPNPHPPASRFDPDMASV